MLYYLYNTIHEATLSLLNMKTSVDEIIPGLWLACFSANLYNYRIIFYNI